MHRYPFKPAALLMPFLLSSALTSGCGGDSQAVLENPATSRALQDMGCSPVPICGDAGTPGTCRLPEDTIWHPDARGVLEECVSRCELDGCLERAAEGLDVPGELVKRCQQAVSRCPYDTDACAALPIVDAEVQAAIDACAGEPCGRLGDCYHEALLGGVDGR